MEVLEAIGKRRSIRFYKDWKKVEDWKIQVILQAARYASCQGNCNSTEAIVIDKATYPKKKWDEIFPCELQAKNWKDLYEIISKNFILERKNV